MTKPTARDLDKARSHLRALLDCESGELPVSTVYPAGWEGFVDQFAEALAAERASLPESVESSLWAIIQYVEARYPPSPAIKLAKEALEDLRKWKSGEW